MRSKAFYFFILFISAAFSARLPAAGEIQSKNSKSTPEPLHIYLDADMTLLAESGASIKRGIETALAEAGNKIDGRRVEIVVKDHQGNTVRSRRHMEEYLKDPRALAVFSGLHSPPLLANRDFINENGILVLDPWAAAAPITRYPSPENWIFRLSIDDSKAGGVIVDYAMNKKEYQNPALLLEQTGWGESNRKSLTKAIRDFGFGSPAVIKMFNWNLTENGAKIILRDICTSGADVVFLVANAPEGKTIARAMASLPEGKRLPICSHWGITGGDFPQEIDAQMREKIKLSFIQTDFSFISSPQTELSRRVFSLAKSLYPKKIKEPVDIKAPAGFIHAYDLTKILIRAAENAGLTGDIIIDRAAVRSALENLDRPVEGLIKVYNKPFSEFTENNPDAHEALNAEDYVMAHYRRDNAIVFESMYVK
ncbi:ABC transporter substrate-binding protein [Sedimentisphaera salicampi]|uniref:ABC transporter substrate-binding protein n=1 Tax=Sedimentisphaera salicampi TaxID=1941349 RepID=UPI000B9AF442|nr:ABC transporter substrate-binding protein [Sedimentisphaera salicampi]OXU15234.1 Receptor family ligand binding region [Sedimentisphaera salicampi]